MMTSTSILTSSSRLASKLISSSKMTGRQRNLPSASTSTSYLPSSFKGRQRSMREYTSMMTVILEIAYDDQEQPVDEELVREAEHLLSFALELQASRQMNKSEAEENSDQMRRTNDASQSEQTNITGKQTKVEKVNGMKRDKFFKRKEMNSEGDDSKMEEEEEEDMVN